MRPFIAVLAAVAAALSCQLPFASLAVVEEPRVAFCGRVTDRDTGAPLARAYVEAQVGYFGWTGGDFTDDAGAYFIAGPGFEGYHYIVTASAEGYLGQGIAAGPAGPPPVRIDFQLYPDPGLSGDPYAP